MAFDQKTFIHTIALNQARRLGMSPGELAACFDAPMVLVNPIGKPISFDWHVWPRQMTSEPWIIARMSADVRQMIADAQFIEGEPDPEGGPFDVTDGRTVGRDDLIALGWPADTVRAYAAVALANALASFKAEAAAITARRQFSGFGSVTASLMFIATFTISLAALGVATLI